MTKLYSLIILFTLLIFSYNPVNASHLTGGEITWKCIQSGSNQGKFVFTVKLYCACYTGAAWCPSSVVVYNPLYAKFGGNSSITCARILNRDVATPCYADSLSMKCGIPASQGGIMAMDENIYVSSPIQINGIPDSTGSDFYWTSCCRPGLLVNTVGNTGYYLRATMYPYTIPGNASPEYLGGTSSGPSCYDSSPKFAALPNITLCIRDMGTIDNSTTEDDCDSNRYTWALPMISATNNVIFKTGFSVSSQLPGPYFYASNVGGLLDSSTGIINYKIDSIPASGYYVICNKAQSYRDGQLISEIYRDMVYYFMDCNLSSGGVSNSNSPTIEIKEAASPTYLTNFNKMFIVGNPIELDIRIQDFDSLPTTPLSEQSVSLEIYGEAMSDKVNNTTSCDISPCAYLDSNNLAWNGEFFIDTTSLVVRFKWSPECKHVKHKTKVSCGAIIGNYEFTIVARDNWCPVPKVTTKKFYITIDDTAGVAMKIDTIDASVGGTYVGWDNYLPANFKNYNVFRKGAAQGSPWIQVGTITNQSQSNFLDPYVNPNGLYDFYHVMTNSGAGCKYEDVLNTLGLQANQSGTNVALAWNKAYKEASVNPTGTYKVYRQDSTSTAWNLILTQPYSLTTSYLDLSPPINVPLKYKVEANDSYKLHAVSNIREITIKKPIDTSSSVTVVIPAKDQPVVYPNPAGNRLNIESPIPYSMDILSLKGEQVGHYELTKGLEVLDISEYVNGMYFLKFKDENGRMHFEKLMKKE